MIVTLKAKIQQTARLATTKTYIKPQHTHNMRQQIMLELDYPLSNRKDNDACCSLPKRKRQKIMMKIMRLWYQELHGWACSNRAFLRTNELANIYRPFSHNLNRFTLMNTMTKSNSSNDMSAREDTY